MPVFSEQCRQRFADDPRVSVLDYGLGACDEQLFLSTADDASSFFRNHDTNGSVAAQIHDVLSVWQELDLEHVDLIKVNIEGGEYPLLRRLIETNLIVRLAIFRCNFMTLSKTLSSSETNCDSDCNRRMTIPGATNSFGKTGLAGRPLHSSGPINIQ